jgi:hypothetical protein
MIESVSGSGLPDVVEAALAQRAYYDLVRSSLEGASPNGGAYSSGDARPRPRRPSRELRGLAARARDRIARADALLVVDRNGPLASMYATARDRFRVGEAEATADRRAAATSSDGGRRAPLPLLPMIVVALMTAILTALVIAAFS